MSENKGVSTEQRGSEDLLVLLQEAQNKFGYLSEEVMADIVYAATVIAAGFYQYGRSGSVGGIKSENIGEYSVSYKNENGWGDLEKAQKILDRYKKFTF